MAAQIEINGFCDDAFAPLMEAFEQNFTEGLEIGASLAATYQGTFVADLWAGYSDRKRTEPWEEDTIACVFSTTKIMAITCVLMVIDRGLMELDQPVAAYWPEFAKHGKDKITVRDAMTHRALVPSFATPQPYTVAHDWERMIELIADEKPWFEPGTLCYHPNNFGYILGELVQRVSGVSIREFFNKEIADPLQADFHLGLANIKDQDRVALLTHPAPSPDEEGSLRAKVRGGFLPPPAGLDLWQTWERQSAVMPAANGHGNARSLAKIGNMLATGGTVDGRTYLSKEIIEEARTVQCHGECPLMGDIKLGLGFGLDGEYFPAPTPSSFHWGGYGGSWCVMDPLTQTSVAYVMNRCVMEEDFNDPRQDRIWEAYRDVLSSLAASPKKLGDKFLGR